MHVCSQVHHGRASPDRKSLCQRSAGVHWGTHWTQYCNTNNTVQYHYCNALNYKVWSIFCLLSPRLLSDRAADNTYIVNIVIHFGADLPVGDDEWLRGRPSRSYEQGWHCVWKHPGHLRVPQQVLESWNITVHTRSGIVTWGYTTYLPIYLYIIDVLCLF